MPYDSHERKQINPGVAVAIIVAFIACLAILFVKTGPQDRPWHITSWTNDRKIIQEWDTTRPPFITNGGVYLFTDARTGLKSSASGIVTGYEIKKETH